MNLRHNCVLFYTHKWTYHNYNDVPFTISEHFLLNSIKSKRSNFKYLLSGVYFTDVYFITTEKIYGTGRSNKVSMSDICIWRNANEKTVIDIQDMTLTFYYIGTKLVSCSRIISKFGILNVTHYYDKRSLSLQNEKH